MPISISPKRLPSVVERGIGRGLAAILPEARDQEPSVHPLPVELIRPNPRQPRSSLDEEGVRELAQSIGEHGVLQPVLVRPLAGSGYELIAGERRWRAARLAGLESVPALVRASDGSEQLELALIENMAREDLNPVEAAQACAALVEELGVTKEEVGRRVGRSRVAISNLIRLLDLPDDVLAMIERGELSEGHGRALLQAQATHARRSLAREARDKGLSVRETEALARVAQAGPRGVAEKRRPRPSADAEAARRDVEDALSAALRCDVRLRFTRAGLRAEISFDDITEIDGLIGRLNGRLAA
jgi:ParB family transcriptional regulator, chromosome partitioning protein